MIKSKFFEVFRDFRGINLSKKVYGRQLLYGTYY